MPANWLRNSRLRRDKVSYQFRFWLLCSANTNLVEMFRFKVGKSASILRPLNLFHESMYQTPGHCWLREPSHDHTNPRFSDGLMTNTMAEYQKAITPTNLRFHAT